MADALRFIRKNGRIIPIHAATGAAKHGTRAIRALKIASGVGVATAGATAIQKHGFKSKEIKVNRALDLTSMGLSVASGVVAAATFTGGWKSMVGGAVASHAIDAAGITANVASVAGKGHLRERTQQAAKQEARNFAIGNGIYAAGLIGVKKNRQELVGYAKKILEFGRKAVNVARNVE